MNLKAVYTKALFNVLKEDLSEKEVEALIEFPKHEAHGDLAFPCFRLASVRKQAPNVISADVAGKLSDPLIERAEAAGPYVNIFFNRKEVSTEALRQLEVLGPKFGDGLRKEKNVVFDFSSPNIAKPFSMGHLRSTIIGRSLAGIAEKNGYNAVKINHLGDWGTQFGKLMCAYTRWGSEAEVRENPIPALMRYYVRYHEEAEKAPELDDEARAWFKKLEDQDVEAVKLWNWFKEESLKEFSKVYDLLGIEFDHMQGESFYNDKMAPVAAELEEKNLLVESDGAMVVETGEDEPPCLIKKKDGTTLYATRDLAAAIYRKKQFDFHKCVYVVGAEQQLHFSQVKTVLGRMGYNWTDDLVHVPFGLILQGGKKMSTRKGKIVLLEDVLRDAIGRAERNIVEKNPSLENREEVAMDVGTGAVVFHDLKNERINSVEFNLEHMLTFEGETGPYVQYTHARAMTLLERAEADPDPGALDGDEAWAVVKELLAFPSAVERAWSQYEPSVIAKYVLGLSSAFNSYYGKVRILEDDDQLQARLALVKAVTDVLKEGLGLLGVKAPDRM
ncbi:arginine--tRNA ligase [Alteribacter natronophilus]|uniref:arginine--tRNA ligase n=1 Tax=Alteribacter natronophilus TaxID=2583810 RepID=UPI00110DB1DD|nr:arginine--tRNA ligase [Alteribacter natronophilus]TMW70154.1 arginine--tRNA ligase [Alteribacter natronophilus]